MSGPPVVLIGPMASGKTKVGSRVARLLDVPFSDTDRMIVAEHGPIADIFALHGEERFRSFERDAVRAALTRDHVVALGGGAVLDPGTQADLEDAPVVYLTVSPEVVATRLHGRTRPLVAGEDPVAAWTRILRSRQGIYERLAHLTLDTSAASYDAIAQEVAQWAQQT